MEIKIVHGIQGAKQAQGIAVIIDVFRAFSLECYMHASKPKHVFCVGDIETCFAYRKKYPSAILFGERNGIQIEGFDYSNSPWQIQHVDLHDKIVVHTTSAGVQGLTMAKQADCVLAGSLCNAKATANWILKQNSSMVTLVAMGWNGLQQTPEDILCANYIKALLEHQPYPTLYQEIEELKYTEGKKFFDETKPQFPQQDFALCTQVDYFNGVNQIIYHADGLESVWIDG